MPIIQKLHPLLIAKIAAGEVIERPVSVIKELIENAIDAKATDIRVEVFAGGSESLIVSDDGSGIEESEMALAFEHHATSKIMNDSDLFQIKTLGFRGEALPSIASVARVKMLSRVSGSNFGYQLENAFGLLSEVTVSACQPGTQISVSNIFDNLPARKKFQKTSRSENIKIKDIIIKYTCAYPSTKFRLILDGKTILNSPGNGNLKDAITGCFGSEISSELINVDFERDGHQISGYVSPTHIHRSNRQGMIFFVNGRSVNNLLLSRSLTEAYHGLIPEKRFPLGVLNLTIPFDELDVNAHPAKTEIRFLRESQIYVNLQRAVRENISQFSGIAPIQRTPEPFNASISSPVESPANQGNMLKNLPEFQDTDHTVNAPGSLYRDVLRDMHIIGQVKLTYIVGETASGIYLVDQHAAHERITFDKLNRNIKEDGEVPQVLLQPIHLELTSEQFEYFSENKSQLEANGIIAEHFGDTSFLIRAIPHSIAVSGSQNFIEDILDQLGSTLGGIPNYSLIATIACHSSIRAGQRLPMQEMISLISELSTTDNPHTCPHGRPTVLELNNYFLEKSFGRVK